MDVTEDRQTLQDLYGQLIPPYHPGPELHGIKQERIRRAMKQHGLDALLLVKPESVRYATDFYAKGFKRFWELTEGVPRVVEM